MAPEALNKETYNEKVDIFSYGVILRLLLTGDAAAAMSENDVVEINVDQSSSQIDNDGSESKRSISTAMQLLIGTIKNCIYNCTQYVKIDPFLQINALLPSFTSDQPAL